MFESDSWLNWDPDPARASRDADPALDPYASMTKSQLLELMLNAKGGREWEFLQEYFLDRCSPEEIAAGTAAFLERQYGAFGVEMLCFLEGAVELALRRRNSDEAGGRRPDPAAGRLVPPPGDCPKARNPRSNVVLTSPGPSPSPPAGLGSRTAAQRL